MEQKENENSVAFRLKRHLGKMSAQVDYLIRNNKLLTQLDIDNLMTNTRELYDMLCSVNANMDVCSIPFEIENEGDNEENENMEREEGIEREENFEETEEDVEENEDVEEELPTESFELNIEEDDDEVNEERESEEEDDAEDEAEDEEAEAENEDIEDDVENEEAEDDEVSDVEGLSDLTEEDAEMFINELFRGNEERFSKVMAELEEAPTWKAALTHLEEMSIAYGWSYDSPAYQKLVELLERRY